MATYTNVRAARSVADDATFRAWGSWIAARIVDCGWVKTTEVGEINWGSVSKPGAINTVAGFAVFRTNDGGTTIYMKVEFGVGGAVTTPSLWITLGTATDGSGNLTSLFTRQQVSGTNTSVTAVDYVAGDTGRLAICSSCPVGTLDNLSMVVVVQRAVDSTGAEIADGSCHLVLAGNAFLGQQTKGGTQRTAGLTSLLFRTTAPGTIQQVPVFGVYAEWAAKLELMRDVLLVPSSWSGIQSGFTLTHYGGNKTFLAGYSTSTAPVPIRNYASSIALSICMRWE